VHCDKAVAAAAAYICPHAAVALASMCLQVVVKLVGDNAELLEIYSLQVGRLRCCLLALGAD